MIGLIRGVWRSIGRYAVLTVGLSTLRWLFPSWISQPVRGHLAGIDADYDQSGTLGMEDRVLRS